MLVQDCAFEYSQMPGIHASPQELEHPFNQTTLYKLYKPKNVDDISFSKSFRT